MDDERARQLLADERTRVTALLRDEEAGDTDSPVREPGDVADAAEELRAKELRLARIDALQEELRRIDAADERLDAGTYGISVVSGVQIPDERLEVAPTADRTAEEEAERERR